jgi:RNA-directed DNA polymerase
MNPRQLARLCTLERMADWDNLFAAAALARRGKSRRPDVEDWWLRREVELAALREELLAGAYEPGPYHVFTIHEPKHREIAAAPFRDRVVHHALCRQLAPVLERRFIARSFSCQRGKGTTAARECCRQLTNRFRYVLKCDVRKFFPSIDHAVLRKKLAEKVHCPGARELAGRIIGSFRTGPEVPVALFAGDDLVEAADRPRGLPIGNLTSQLWGNFYLDGLDHWVTEVERHGAYVRYTDDFLLFGDDKAGLGELRAGIMAQLGAVRLKLAEPKSRLLAAREGVPFCGFRFQPDLRPRVLGATKRRFERRRRTLARVKDFSRLTESVFAWYQFSREGNSEGLRRAYARWPLATRPERRRQPTARVLRGGSWDNDNPDNLSSSYRNNNTPDNRNDNIGFRVVRVGGGSGKAASTGEIRGGHGLPRPCQEASLTAVPVPR